MANTTQAASYAGVYQSALKARDPLLDQLTGSVSDIYTAVMAAGQIGEKDTTVLHGSLIALVRTHLALAKEDLRRTLESEYRAKLDVVRSELLRAVDKL